MKSSEIRQKFLKFFEARGHRVVRSSSLVPANDPTLLFSNAGMNQFKDVFLGREKRDYARAASCQKCVRAGGKHNDLEQVGRTRRHHTFFEMLGNFSFGDYFKKEAIIWAWELVTKDFAIPKAKLYVTVFREDDGAEELWAREAGVERARIVRCDEKDNFWQMGETGPCGPCSEIHYDLGPAASELGHKDCPFPCPDDCGRYVELWNLVFMQFNRDESGNLTPLPRPSIDTGAGLERLAAVLQGKVSNFDTDLFRPLIDEAASLANVEYGAQHNTDVSLRIIADHARAATFLISDGVLPSNEGRGYVLRLILRRALYHGQTLGLNDPFMSRLSGTVKDLMKGPYPELGETAAHVAKAIEVEEERYQHTTRIGLEILDRISLETPLADHMTFGELKSISKKKHQQIVGTGFQPLAKIPGQELFKLHDTFGLRPEFVADIVRHYRVEVDWAGYHVEMEKQRVRARASWDRSIGEQVGKPFYAMSPAAFQARQLAEHNRTVFEGYTNSTSQDCKILAVFKGDLSLNSARPGDEVEIVLDHTPFYAEAGGQVGDVGHLMAAEGSLEVARVRDTYYPVGGLIAHKAVAREKLAVGDVVTAVVDAERRDAIRRSHTATHLLHAALRHTLGTHVKQAGSLVAPDGLRFDYSHYARLSNEDLLDIEDLVNEHVLANQEVKTDLMDLDAAVSAGAMALFGEKYGDTVRVVSIADGSFSKELCGGTHVRRTGGIGLFKVTYESSVAAGTRRIAAVTGKAVLEYIRKLLDDFGQISAALRAKPDELLQAAEKLAESEKKLRKQLEAQQMKRAAAQAGDLVGQAKEIKGVRVLSARVEAMDRAAMRQMVDNLRPKLGSGVIVLGSVADGNVALVAAVTKDLTNKLDAGKIVKAAAAIIEGSGGGRRDLAEAGGKNPSKLDESLAAIPSIVEKML